MDPKKNKIKLYEQPWLALITELGVGISVLILVIAGANLVGIPGDAPWRALIAPGLAHVLVLFIIVPFVLKLPSGKQSYREYLSEIRLTNLKPFLPLLILGFSCSLLALLALATQSIAFRFSQELPVSLEFLRGMIPLKNDLPPSTGYITAFPAIFEEITWRGVMLVLFLRVYSAKQSILITGLGFSLLHLLNLLFGVDPAFVVRQIILGAGMGIFYGVLVLRTNSLLPAMLFHYLVNMFIGSFTSYLQHYAPDRTMILYLLINIPFTTVLLITWVKFYTKRWLSKSRVQFAGQNHLALEQQ